MERATSTTSETLTVKPCPACGATAVRHERRGDSQVQICDGCGRRSYRLIAEPGRFVSAISPLGPKP